MDNNSVWKPRIVLFIFIFMVILDWLYSVWVKSEQTLSAHTWFMVMPLIFYFYFALAFISAIGIYFRDTLSLMMAACILLFGSTTCVLSYLFVYRSDPLLELFIIPLIFLNLIAIVYMAFQKSYFKKK